MSESKKKRRRSYKGTYKPKNPDKYAGNVKNIVYRSLLERTFMVWLDTNPSVLKWSSEEDIIPYISPVDNRYHRYFPDFRILCIDADTKKPKEYLIEVKPYSQTQEPKQSKKKHWKSKQRYIRECMTYAVNQAKWKAAQKICEQNDITFKILTEKEIRRFNNGEDIYKK